MTQEQEPTKHQPKPTPPPLPLSSLNQLDGKAWRGFFSLTGGSILYCLSALSIIYGIARILGPLLARTDILRDAYPCLAALNIYEIALLGVLVFIVVWEKVTDDAISLLVLVALFLVGSGLTLTTVANSGQRAALLIGSVCFLAGAGKLYVLKRYVGLALNRWALAGLAVILAWNFGAGPLLARSSTLGSIDRDSWLLSFLFLIAGGVIVFISSMTSCENTKGESGKSTPFLWLPGAQLMFASILLVAGAVHQYVLGYVFDISSNAGDYLPLVSVVSMIALQLSLSIRSRPAFLEAGLAGVPVAACCCAVLSKSLLTPPSFGIEAIWHPPVLLGLTGLAVFWIWLRTRSPHLLGVCGAYLLGVILTLGFSPGNPSNLNWHATGALFVSACLLIGLLRRNIALCVIAVIVGTVGLSTTGSFQRIIAAWSISHLGLVGGLAGLGTLLMALVFGKKTPQVLLALGALGVMGFVFDLLPSKLTTTDLIPLAGLLILSTALWMRTRDLPSLVILLIPIAQRAWLLFTELTAWRYVILSFVLLFAGAWMSMLKGRRSSRRDSSTDNTEAESTSNVEHTSKNNSSKSAGNQQ